MRKNCCFLYFLIFLILLKRIAQEMKIDNSPFLPKTKNRMKEIRTPLSFLSPLPFKKKREQERRRKISSPSLSQFLPFLKKEKEGGKKEKPFYFLTSSF